MDSCAHHIDACLASLGTEAFAPAFAELVETLGIDQIMVFTIEGDHARCLLSRHFRRDALAGQLARTYLNGWFRHDPLLPDLLETSPGTVWLRRLDEIEARMSREYRRIFFDVPGLRAKTSLLCAGKKLRMFVNLYQGGDGLVQCDPDLARLSGRLALMHFERISESLTPPPLAVLSERERAVCLGIFSGRKAEMIAADLGVAVSTVVTYRKRAYAKLGVACRAELFAICKK